jgi:predicted nuclease of predicted toxin-antitoxin system
MKLLLDACMPLEWAEFLRRNGHECIAWLDLGPPNASDTDIMAWAHKHGFVVLTNDLDFGKLLAFSRATHPSVIQFRARDIRPTALGSLALQALKEHHTRLEGPSGEGALITIETERFRTRILPLSPD